MSNIKDRYAFVTDKKENWQCIGIVGGRYEGVIYKYGKVTIPEPPEENYKGDLPLKFVYDIVDTNGLPEGYFGDDFDKLIGDILVNILDDQLNKGMLQYVTDNCTNSIKPTRL